MSKIQIKKSQIDKLILETVNKFLTEQKIKEGGPGSGQKGHKTKEDNKGLVVHRGEVSSFKPGRTKVHTIFLKKKNGKGGKWISVTGAKDRKQALDAAKKKYNKTHTASREDMYTDIWDTY